MEHSLENNRSGRLNTVDPSLIFLIKSLLYPVAAAGSMLVALVFWREPLQGPYLLASILAFLGTTDMQSGAPLHRQTPHFSASRMFFDILARWVVVAGFCWAVVYAVLPPARTDYRVMLTWTLLTPAVLWLAVLLNRALLFHLGDNLIVRRTAVVVGMTDLGLRLAGQLRGDALLGIDVLGFFEARTGNRLPQGSHERLLGTPAELSGFVERNAVNVVYITLPMTRHPRILDLLDSLRDSTASVYFVPDMFVFDLVQARFDMINGIPVVAVCESPFYGLRGIAKRGMDIAVAGSILLAIWPLLLLIALGVRLSSPGPVLFKQRRYGLDGKDIVVYKFRTMTVTEDGDTHYTQVTRNDIRVTPFGALLRKTSLDELPQLLNVLAGSMSLVGPRPHAVAVNEQYRRLIRGYMVRHKVKPGITGWAQINGYRGGDDLPSMTKRIEYDLEYLRHWSLGMDLSILLKTAAVVWADRSAY
jgi:putative colanic acid biosynthesis UDP-glucose lipid carrier transferase